MARRKAAEIKDDPRVVALAECVLFALNGFRNKPIYDHATKQMTDWHKWFRESLSGAGYTVIDPRGGKGVTDGR